MKAKRAVLLSVVFLLPLVAILSQCGVFDKKTEDPRGPRYAGAESCLSCHKDVYNSYLHTAHFKSTRNTTEDDISGDLRPGHNEFRFNDSLKVVMEKRADGVYQAGYIKGKKVDEQRFDITFGGVKAETYLYWKDNLIYQLPISYFDKLHNWTNSPGYDTTRMDFGRIIGKRCFECHSSYISELPMPAQGLQQTIAFDKATLINGIDCERCHGPAANHVNFHTEYPNEKKPKYITSYASLSRAQKLDMCAVCHSGNNNMVMHTTFDFKPGDMLSAFVEQEYFSAPTDAGRLDVHGNQSQMLAASTCFIKSKMDCNTCHNTHVNERGSLALYSQRCMSCHSTAGHNFCKMASKLGDAIKTNCIDCHMPLRLSSIIAVQTADKGRAAPYMVRTHRVAVYENDKKKVLAFLNKR